MSPMSPCEAHEYIPEIRDIQKQMDIMESTQNSNMEAICGKIEVLTNSINSHVIVANELLKRSEKALPMKLVFWVVGIVFVAVIGGKISDSIPLLIPHFFK